MMRTNRPNAGFTMVELLLSLGILVVAVGGLVAATASAFSLHTAAKEQLLAKEAAVQTLETIRSYALDNFQNVFRKFNGKTSDDPAATEEDGFTIGLVGGTVKSTTVTQIVDLSNTDGDVPTDPSLVLLDPSVPLIYTTTIVKSRMVFSVPSFQAIDPQATLTVDFPGDGLSLYEYLVGAAFGGPFDLNGNGVIDGGDVAGTYQYLPVTVTVNWTSQSGRAISQSYYTILAERR